MKILICDDENTYADELKSFIENYFLLRHLPVEITMKCDPMDIVNDNLVYEIAFLDIQMENIDGLSLAKILKSRNSKVAIFFITSFGRYQDDAMDLNAFRFFEKPFDPDRLYSGLDRVMEYIDRTYVDFSSIQMGCIRKSPPMIFCMLKETSADPYCTRSARHVPLVNHLISGKMHFKAHTFIRSTNRLSSTCTM